MRRGGQVTSSLAWFPAQFPSLVPRLTGSNQASIRGGQTQLNFTN